MTGFINQLVRLLTDRRISIMTHRYDREEHLHITVDINIHADEDRILAELSSGFDKLFKQGKNIMATLDEFITAQNGFNAALETALTDIGGDIQNLNDQIAALVAAGGTLTPAQQAALDALVVSGTALQAKADALNALTPPVVPAG
jgi:hypothetical protein